MPTKDARWNATPPMAQKLRDKLLKTASVPEAPVALYLITRRDEELASQLGTAI